MAMAVQLLLATGVLGLGVLLHIVALGTPNWIEADANSDYSYGLFKGCNADTCADLEDPSSELEACQAMAVIGMIAGIGALALALLSLIFGIIGKSVPKLFPLLCAAAGIAAFIFIIIGVIVYAAEIYDPLSSLYSYGFSFGLSITGGILCLVGGILVKVFSGSSE